MLCLKTVIISLEKLVKSYQSCLNHNYCTLHDYLFHYLKSGPRVPSH